MINKDTKIYGSFSSTPGNNGCLFFNEKFNEDKINAIYKSFYSNDIKKSIEAAKTLGLSGFAISMPFKQEIIKYLDTIDSDVRLLNACNTVINRDGKLIGYNTDWKGAYKYLENKYMDNEIKSLTILGNGGFSKAVQYACYKLDISHNLITRNNWHKIPETTGTIFNTTPVEISTDCDFIDGRPSTETGKELARLQAIEQYKLYTNELS